MTSKPSVPLTNRNRYPTPPTLLRGLTPRLKLPKKDEAEEEEILEDMEVDDEEQQQDNKEREKEEKPDSTEDKQLPKSASLRYQKKEDNEGRMEDITDADKKEEKEKEEKKDKEKEKEKEEQESTISKPWLETEEVGETGRIEMTMTREDLARQREELETFMSQWRAHGSNLAEGEKVRHSSLYIGQFKI